MSNSIDKHGYCQARDRLQSCIGSHTGLGHQKRRWRPLERLLQIRDVWRRNRHVCATTA